VGLSRPVMGLLFTAEKRSTDELTNKSPTSIEPEFLLRFNVAYFRVLINPDILIHKQPSYTLYLGKILRDFVGLVLLAKERTVLQGMIDRLTETVETNVHKTKVEVIRISR
jgi:hypothetical protein